MREIDKLRQRLKNSQKGAIEYRMTIQEAKALVEEFNNLEKKLEEKPKETIIETPTIITQVLDGGTF